MPTPSDRKKFPLIGWFHLMRRLQGIYYRSRYGHDLESWAIFKPFAISDTVVESALQPDDQDFLVALKLHHLSF